MPGASSERSSSYPAGDRQSAGLMRVPSSGRLLIVRAGNMHAELVPATGPAGNAGCPRGKETSSMRRAAVQKMAKTVLRYPLRTGQMALPRAPGTIRFAFWIDVQNDFCHFLPVCPFCVGVEQAQIGDEMLLVVARQIPVGRRNVRDRRIERWRLHVSLHSGRWTRRQL